MILGKQAQLFTLSGERTKAEKIYRDNLSAQWNKLGENHPITLKAARNLAIVIGVDQQYAESEKLLRMSVEGFTDLYGHDHPETLKSVSNLGRMLEDSGRFEEAEKNLRKAYEGHCASNSERSSSTLRSAFYLANILRLLRRYDEAQFLYRKVMDFGRPFLGKLESEFLQSIQWLAWIAERNGNLEESISLCESLVKETENIHGANDRRTNSAWRRLRMTQARKDKTVVSLSQIPPPVCTRPRLKSPEIHRLRNVSFLDRQPGIRKLRLSRFFSLAFSRPARHNRRFPLPVSTR